MTNINILLAPGLFSLLLTLEEEQLGEEETLEGLGRRGGGRGGGGLGGREQETREHAGQGQDDGLKTEILTIRSPPVLHTHQELHDAGYICCAEDRRPTDP